MDLIVSAPRIPAQGETIIGRGFHTAARGKGANQATARLSAQASIMGRVGDDAYYNHGTAYRAKGDTDRVIADFDQAIQLQSDFLAYMGRGLAYADKGDYDHAIADFDQAIQLRPDLAEAYYYRGKAYSQKGEKEKAIADLKRFLELSDDPDWRQQVEKQLKALGAR